MKLGSVFNANSSQPLKGKQSFVLSAINLSNRKIELTTITKTMKYHLSVVIIAKGWVHLFSGIRIVTSQFVSTVLWKPNYHDEEQINY